VSPAAAPAGYGRAASRPRTPFCINVGHPTDVACWTMVLGTTEKVLHDAVNRVDRDVEDMALYLRGVET
jgi:hypothetical protein